MSFKPLKNLLEQNTDIQPKGKSRHSNSPLLALIRHWDKVVGAKLATKTKPLKIKGDTLIILTEHSNFSHHLKLIETEIIKKVIKLLPQLRGEIKTTYFYINDRFFKPEKVSNEGVKKPLKEKKAKLHPYSPEYISMKKDAQKIFLEEDEFQDDLISLYIQLKS